MWYIAHQICTYCVGYMTKAFPVNIARICWESCDNHARLCLNRNPFDFIHVDHLSYSVYSVWSYGIEESWKVEWMSMWQVSSLIQTHTKNRVSRPEESQIYCKICRWSGKRLYIDILCSEEFLCTRDGKIFDDVDIDLPRIVTLSRIPLGIFIHKNTARSFHDSLWCIIFRCYELELFFLTEGLCLEWFVYLRILILKCDSHKCCIISNSLWV